MSPPSARTVFLVGFPGAGKTTAGALAAATLGRRFVDLDDEIARDAGRPTPALVAADEADFRRREAAALARVIATGEAAMVATGGGAAGWGDNLARMKAAGLVVALAVDLDVALARVAASGPRPLLARPAAELTALHAAREVVYRRAHPPNATDGQAADAVAAAIAAVVTGSEAIGRPTPWVVLAERSYPVVVDELPLAAGLHRALGPGKVALVTDANLAPWIDVTRAAIVAALPAGAPREVHVAIVPPGEASKSLATYGALAEELVAAGLDRTSTIVALGGGVVGDLAGFVAATLFRGVAVVHLPTTLVAMTDSAIGGKTAVDLPAGKNLLGAFWQPRRVVAHLPTLATLPPRERQAGFGVLWKYALLDGEPLWTDVAAHAAWAADGSAPAPPSRLAAVIERAATLKAAIVGRDEREERGERALLNLGHTLGHALETEAGGALLHGEAVGLGLIAAARISHRLGLAPAELEPRVTDALRATRLPTDLDARLGPAVLARVGVDKKRRAGELGFIACAAPGACRVVAVRPDALADLLRP
jgi:shikimate kinase/3-dehydroquinate synthase